MAKVLVMDDDEGMRAALRRGLEQAGHEVLEAGDGRDGVEIVRAAKPAVVITDIFMPDQDGIQTIMQLRDLHPDIAIVAMSGEKGWGTFAPLNDARLLGADAAIAKPFPIATLVFEVGRLLERGTKE